MANFSKYTVKPGETLLDVAQKFGVPSNYIKKANNIDIPEEGETLLIPIRHAAGSLDTAESVAKQYAVPVTNVILTTEQRFIVRPPVVFPEYVVQANENLAAIAKKFGVSSEFIAEANDTESPKPGQILKIPIKHNIKLDEPTEAVASLYGVQPSKVVPISNHAVVIPPQTGGVFPKHLVQAGESTNSIANKYNVSANHILMANNVDTLYPGQLINLPLRYSPELSNSPSGLARLYEIPEDHVLDADNVVLPPPRFIEYVFQAGESLNDIAQKYNVETNLITEANPAMSFTPGQILILPVNLITKVNVSASSVGHRYNVPAENVIRQTETTLVKPNPTRFPRHLMQPADTVAEIASTYNIDPGDVLAANHIEAPQAGQILTLPVVKHAGANGAINSLAIDYGVSADDITQTTDRVFYVLPSAAKRSPIAPLPILAGLVALLALVLVGALLYRFWPGQTPPPLAVQPETAQIGTPANTTNLPALFQQNDGQPGQVEISAPANNANLLLGSPVQVLSRHSADEISRVELYVSTQGQADEKLMRADIPVDGVVMQAWLPPAEGNYTLRVVSVNANNQPVGQSTVQIRVAANPAISRPEQQVDSSGQIKLPAGGQAFQPPPGATPGPVLSTPPAAPPVQPLAACSAYNAPGAPVIRDLRVAGVENGTISRAANAPAQEITLGLGEDLALEWGVDNASAVEFIMTNQATGVAQPPVTSNNGQVSIPLTEVGTFQISMRAYPVGECQQPVEKPILTTKVEGKIMQAAAMPTLVIPPTPTATIEPTATPTRYFDPPPPAPGVPPGPTQKQLPELRPPVCDAADLLGVYTPSSGQRIEIKEPDDIPAKTVGGATVFRSWRLQNTGTCTWGPGYELAYYGGRSMGSGGVSFENTWPSDPDRRNIVIDGNRLIVPEGKPNQVAVVEVMLQAPVTPGIHQSYWRMRNPQGVYFGPIMGVTLEVVRQCEFGIYGAPTINKFEILGVGNVYRPVNPISVEAEQGDPVTLDWNVINATNVDIVIESPTGETETLSTGDPSDRKQFIPNRLGRYIVTLYADNGPCTVSAVVYVEVYPPEDSTETFIFAMQQTADISDIRADFNHANKNVDQFLLVAQRYAKASGTSCWFGLAEQTVWDWAEPVLCSQNSGYTQVAGSSMPAIYGMVAPSEGIFVPANDIPQLTPNDSAVFVPSSTGGGQLVNRGAYTLAQLPWQGDNAGYATIRNVLWGLCPPNGGDYKVLFALTGYSKGKQVGSKTAELSCDAYSKGYTRSAPGAPVPQPTSTLPIVLPKEIPDDSGQ